MGKTITPQKGCYIGYMLKVRGITQEDVARRAGLTQRSVSAFLTGVKNSEKVKRAIAEALGFPSFEAVMAASYGKEAI